MFRFSDYGIESDIVILAMIAVFIVLLILLIVAFVKIGKMKKKYVAFMEGKDGKSLEETFHKKFENMDSINEELKKIQNHLELVDENLLQTYQKVSIVKYDAFKEIGGTLSFVLVMLTKDNDGFILNSMHSNSEGCYTYIKEVKSGEVFVALSEEERQALEEAKES
ncbi:MAG: DUF4446 family protein [Clostridiales bacterium]|nr:DUF4446 family protein [Clostridiales bacterium]MDD7350538.1 DUF4446 family protein [Clostridiales bacterium]